MNIFNTKRIEKTGITSMPSGKPIIGKNDLLSQRPDIAAEWDYKKNIMRPEDYCVTSSKQVYWIDELGHSWKAIIGNRTRESSGCPYCGGKKVLKGFNDLASQYPELVPEWDAEKNGLQADEVVCTGHKRYHWKCPVGHEWTTEMYLRTVMHTGCPQCERKGTSFPEQAIYYYISKSFPDAVNGSTEFGTELDIYIPSIKTAIEYDGAVFHSRKGQMERDNNKDALCNKKGIALIRVREKGLTASLSANCIFRSDNESDEALDECIRQIFNLIGERPDFPIKVSQDHIKIRGQYYSYLKSNTLERLYPDIAAEWYYPKNENVTPAMVNAGSGIKVWWQCKKYKDHIWEDSIAHRTGSGRGCPYCSNERVLAGFNDLASRNKKLVGEWSSNNSVHPSEVSPTSHHKYLWICPECHREYSASPANRSKGRGCPYCAHIRPVIGENDFKAIYEGIAKEWDYEKNKGRRPEEFLSGSEFKAWWTCPKGHSYQQSIKKRALAGQGCPYCSGNKVEQGKNDLASQRPDLAAQWMEER